MWFTEIEFIDDLQQKKGKKIIEILFFCSSLKLECEKLASEKIEIQRHYVMVSILCNVYIYKCFIIINFWWRVTCLLSIGLLASIERAVHLAPVIRDNGRLE